ncbi:hypothetical protein L585_08720 [Pantoea ananatis BRT175]|uniref:hypothetical protein n=1 Tax=Pantoea ananas TaxID=553 RepID=UPI0003B207B1|nr:hypothetical protein [Pantoea ananatis]ERM14388.1 hypothetical protein L585_08720 [Pantoea ananatis BRT175]
MKASAVDISEVLNAASRARQLTALLQTMFENGTEGCAKDDELVGLAYDLSEKVSILLGKFESESETK